MLKKAFCEVFTARYASAIRLAIAKELVTTFGVSQLRAAKLAGVPQPLLNYVLHGKRRISGLREIYQSEEALTVIREVARELLEGKSLYLCDVCLRLRQRKALPLEEELTEEECAQMIVNLMLSESERGCIIEEERRIVG